MSGMSARTARREVADLLFIARGHGHDALTLASSAFFVKQPGAAAFVLQQSAAISARWTLCDLNCVPISVKNVPR
jgi:hypothetical protein